MFWCSKEPSHRDGSFEYPQHMFWMRNKENKFPIRALIWRPAIQQHVCPWKTQTSRDINPSKCESSLITNGAVTKFLRTDSKDSVQSRRMQRLSDV